VVIDDVLDVPLGPGGGPPSRGTAAVFIDPDTFEWTYEMVLRSALRTTSTRTSSPGQSSLQPRVDSGEA